LNSHPSEDAGRALIHEFRNLLAVIVNYSELIAEEVNDPEAVKADIQEVRSAAERAIVLTDQLPRPEPKPS
jgi:signal transduction histidine kinase